MLSAANFAYRKGMDIPIWHLKCFIFLSLNAKYFQYFRVAKTECNIVHIDKFHIYYRKHGDFS